MKKNILNAMINGKLLRSELTAIRKSQRLTQAKVADMAGISVSTVSKIESGEENGVMLESLIRYAEALDCELFVNLRERKDDKSE